MSCRKRKNADAETFYEIPHNMLNIMGKFLSNINKKPDVFT